MRPVLVAEKFEENLHVIIVPARDTEEEMNIYILFKQDIDLIPV